MYSTVNTFGKTELVCKETNSRDEHYHFLAGIKIPLTNLDPGRTCLASDFLRPSCARLSQSAPSPFPNPQQRAPLFTNSINTTAGQQIRV